jgi:hypothetical protein
MGQLDDGLPSLVRLPDDGELLGRFDRQRAQEHGVDGAEDRAVGPDGKCQRDDRRCRIPGRSEQLADRVTDIRD